MYFLLSHRFAEQLSLSQGASVETRGPTSYRPSTFEQYDAITFVVIVLNFLREDASPLLTPATTAVQEGAPEGVSAGKLRIAVVVYVRRTYPVQGLTCPSCPGDVKCYLRDTAAWYKPHTSRLWISNSNFDFFTDHPTTAVHIGF